MSYIDVGDHVFVTEGVLEDTHKRKARPELVGKQGLVVENDGWGFCRVLIEDGTYAHLWNTKDLRLNEG